jgi:hypothetical protein
MDTLKVMANEASRRPDGDTMSTYEIDTQGAPVWEVFETYTGPNRDVVSYLMRVESRGDLDVKTPFDGADNYFSSLDEVITAAAQVSAVLVLYSYAHFMDYGLGRGADLGD